VRTRARAIRKYERYRTRYCRLGEALRKYEHRHGLAGWMDDGTGHQVYREFSRVGDTWSLDPVDKPGSRIAKIPDDADPDAVQEWRRMLKLLKKYRRKYCLAALEIRRIEEEHGVPPHDVYARTWWFPLEG